MRGREHGTTTSGAPFDAGTIRAVWSTASPIPDLDPDEWRADACGARMRFSDHGNVESPFGWEIDHVIAVDHGGTDDVENLQALHWSNNRAKGDGALRCVVIG